MKKRFAFILSALLIFSTFSSATTFAKNIEKSSSIILVEFSIDEDKEEKSMEKLFTSLSYNDYFLQKYKDTFPMIILGIKLPRSLRLFKPPIC